MARYIYEYRRDVMSAQVVYPAEILKLMGLRKDFHFASMQMTQCCCLDFDQCLFGAAVFAITRFQFAFWIVDFLSSSVLVFQVPQFEEKAVPMVNVQMAFLLFKAG